MSKDAKLLIYGYGGIGQTYFPMLHADDSDASNGYAYMLKIDNDDNIWNEGQYLSSAGGIKIFPENRWMITNACDEWRNGREININITKLFEGIGNNFGVGTKDAFTYKGKFNKAQINIYPRGNIIKTINDAYTTEELCESMDSPPSNFEVFIKAMSHVWNIASIIWGLKP